MKGGEKKRSRPFSMAPFNFGGIWGRLHREGFLSPVMESSSGSFSHMDPVPSPVLELTSPRSSYLTLWGRGIPGVIYNDIAPKYCQQYSSISIFHTCDDVEMHIHL
jgi:hypothetical protein